MKNEYIQPSTSPTFYRTAESEGLATKVGGLENVTNSPASPAQRLYQREERNPYLRRAFCFELGLGIAAVSAWGAAVGIYHKFFESDEHKRDRLRREEEARSEKRNEEEEYRSDSMMGGGASDK